MAISVSILLSTLACFILQLASISCSNAQEFSPTSSEASSKGVAQKRILEYDPNGYVLFCTCMGRFGNQIDHFLGGMAFAKAVNRTLLLPPFTTYKNQPFTKWFKLEALQRFHRSEAAEDFMQQLAPVYWPPDKRVAFCWLPMNHKATSCKMKDGNPFGPFWNGLGVDFAMDEIYSLHYADHSAWSSKYPPDKYLVLAMRGAPATFPLNRQNRKLQQYLEFTEEITVPADDYVWSKFGSEKFIALHLRNGVDWFNACSHVVGQESFMASPQCLNEGQTVTKELCFPSKETILKLVKKICKKTKIKFIYVATDKNPMIQDLEKALSKLKVRVFHKDPFQPWEDLHVFSKADYFIGNCVSSFTAFAKRARDIKGKPTFFWGLD